MKKELNKIIIFIGFILCVVGLIIASMSIDLSYTYVVPALLALTFIFAKNSVVKNVGYGLCAINISTALTCLFGSVEFVLIGVGLIVMFIGALIYFLTLVLAFFGFVKGEAKTCPAQTTDLLVAIGKYKDLVNETVLSEEEFIELKKNLLASTSKKAASIDDLKRWKKAVEQSLITEDEYQSIKSSILTK